MSAAKISASSFKVIKAATYILFAMCQVECLCVQLKCDTFPWQHYLPNSTPAPHVPSRGKCYSAAAEEASASAEYISCNL